MLFCDLVESTALSQRLDPEDLREVQQAFRQLCTEVAVRHDAHVAQYVGDGLVLYFGYPRAQDNDAERSVRCGLDLARRVAGVTLPVPVVSPLAVRIGIHTGPVAFGPAGPEQGGEWTAYGSTTNIAARLQAQAEPGQVVVSDVTWRLAKDVATGHCLGPLSLKGVLHPTVAWRVHACATDASEDRSGERVLSPFVGRGREFARLEDAWKAAAAGESRFVLLRGDPGMGKSRLARSFRARVESECRPLWTRATPNSRNQPFHPVVVLLERALRQPQEHSQPSSLIGIEDALQRLDLDPTETLPFLAPLLGMDPGDRYLAPPLSPARLREQSLDTLARVLGALASLGPTLLIVEDLHWADASTIELMEHMMARLSRVPLLVVLTTRPELSPSWAAGSPLDTINLQRLTADESEAIARSVAGSKALPGDVLRQILARSDGVPLFVEELTRSALESGVLEERAASWEAIRPVPTDLIPVAIHTSLAARIDRLGPARVTAQLAATIGREFSLGLLTAVSDRPPATVRHDLELLKSADLAWESGESGPDNFVFKHSLVRDAAYESLLRQTRQSYHARIAKALRTLDTDSSVGRADLIASHLTHAGELEEAVNFWEAAGEEALRRTANLEASGHFERAIECLVALDSTVERKSRELDLQNRIAPILMSVYGWASSQVERASARAKVLTEELGRVDQLYAPMWGLWSVYFLRGELLPAQEAAEAVQRMADGSKSTLLQVTGQHATSYTRLFRGEIEQALEEADGGLSLFDFEQEQALASAFQLSSSVCLRQSRAQALWMLGRIAEADEEADRMLRLARDLNHRPSLAAGLAFALHGEGLRHSYPKQMQGLSHLADELKRLAHDEGFFMWHAVAEIYEGLIGAALGQGGWRPRLFEGLELFAQTRTRVTLVMMYVLAAEALHRASRDAEALQLLDQAETEMANRREHFCGPEIWRVRGRVHARAGHVELAEVSLQRALDLAEQQRARALGLRAALDLHDLLAASARIDEGRARLEQAFVTTPWPLDRPEPARASEILNSAPHDTPPCEWSLSCPTTPAPFPGLRSSGPLSAT